MGNSVSNGGNAYRVVTAGTSAATGGPTGTGSAITDGTVVWRWLSAIDYTSLQAWANGLPATLAQAAVAQLWNNNGAISTAAGTPYLSLTGHTTTATNNITVTTAPGESFRNSFTRTTPLAFNSALGASFVLPSTTGSINYFNISDSNVVFDGLQFQDPNSTSGSTIIAASQNFTIRNCIIDGYGQTGGASIFGFGSGVAGSSVLFENNLTIDRAPSGITGAGTVNINCGGAFANNTFVAINAPPSLLCIINQSVAAVTQNVTNNIFVGYSSGDTIATSGAATSNVSYNVTTAASITGAGVVLGSGNIYSATAAALFVSPTTDFRILASSVAANAGTTDTTDIPSATDIIGTSRPQGTAWDIGAFELTAAIAAGAAAGTSTASAVGSSYNSARGVAAGTSTATASPPVPNIGNAAGTSTATAAGSSVASSAGTAIGTSTATGFFTTASVLASINITPIPSQSYETPFPVSGTYTIAPTLQYADDSSPRFTTIRAADVSPLGSTTFSFNHPGMPLGTHTLLIEDASTSISVATDYSVGPAPAALRFAATAFPPAAPTFVQSIIPAYLYQEYADDDDVQAFISAYNGMAQNYLDWMRNINLPVYTGGQISGALLDWVATGLYGIARPALSFTQTTGQGAFDTYPLGFLPLDGAGANNATTLYTVTDDIFKRIITWSFYKGDGKVFSVRWLKRRVARFLAGVNGTDYGGQTHQISVSFVGTSTINITISGGSIPTTYAPVFQAALLSGVLPMPFQYAYNILLK